MKNKAFCLGGSQDGVKVCLNSSQFYTPNHESYSMCELSITNQHGYPVPQQFWKADHISMGQAMTLANQYRPR